MAELMDIDEAAILGEEESVQYSSDAQDASCESCSEDHRDNLTSGVSTAHRLERIPRNIDVKKRFEEHYRMLLGKDYDRFMNYSLSYIRKCIRVNTLKADVGDIKMHLEGKWLLESVPWCSEGFWITYRDGKRFDLGNLIEHHLGYVYVQEAASMIPPVVLGPLPGERVLDMCAAPGSKTTQIASYMENKGILVANDIIGSRLKALGMNMQRCGVNNAVITMMQDNRFKSISSRHEDFRFDRILVDAPCSGTGTIRKSLKTITTWNPGVITKLSRLQKTLIETAFGLLVPGGTLVYSTCTIEPEENEAVVSYLLKNHSDARLEEIDKDSLGIVFTKPITEFPGLDIIPEVSKCLRIHPYDNDTEGFFVAKIKKVS